MQATCRHLFLLESVVKNSKIVWFSGAIDRGSNNIFCHVGSPVARASKKVTQCLGYHHGNPQNLDSSFRFLFEDFPFCARYMNVNYGAGHV